MSLVINKIISLLAGKKRLSKQKKRSMAFRHLEKALQYALGKNVTIRYIHKRNAYCLCIEKYFEGEDFKAIIPVNRSDSTAKSTAKLPSEIAGLSLWGDGTFTNITTIFTYVPPKGGAA
jgi:hypothetical protein